MKWTCFIAKTTRSTQSRHVQFSSVHSSVFSTAGHRPLTPCFDPCIEYVKHNSHCGARNSVNALSSVNMRSLRRTEHVTHQRTDRGRRYRGWRWVGVWKKKNFEKLENSGRICTRAGWTNCVYWRWGWEWGKDGVEINKSVLLSLSCNKLTYGQHW